MESTLLGQVNAVIQQTTDTTWVSMVMMIRKITILMDNLDMDSKLISTAYK
jgi:tRNA isopentenyl-2-thiomethyl-A-37 hydroxylase MiaE